MPLDPIVSLAVALAEAPGSIALFLGSGVSVDAGIPTGWAIYIDGVQRLRRLEEGDVEPLADDEIEGWLERTGRSGFNYSRLLEDLAPDAATRRSYIAAYFADAAPGTTHERVADLVARGVIKVIVTTNFDRMLEQALSARGIEPVVASDDASLAAMPRREHADCFLLKVHGDYQQETIRNTPAELSQLEAGVSAELQAVLDRYGVVLVGYSGNDEAIRKALRARSSRYGLWWLSVSDPPRDPIPELLERTAGRPIIRASASEFLTELSGRLAAYEAHPSGHTPASVHDEVLALLRAADRIGVAEALRRESHAYIRGLSDWTAAHSADGNTYDAIEGALPGVTALVERQIAAILPIALHDPDRLPTAFRTLTRAVESAELHGLWHDQARWAGWAIGYTVGAVLTGLERWSEALTAASTTIARGERIEFLLLHSGDLGRAIGEVHNSRTQQRYLAPDWEHLRETVATFNWLTERYPELMEGKDPPRPYLSAFDFIVNLAAALRMERHLAYWTMGGDAPRGTARRMNADPHALRSLVAVAQDPQLSVETLPTLLAERLPAYSQFFGHFPDWQPTISVLLTGAARE